MLENKRKKIASIQGDSSLQPLCFTVYLAPAIVFWFQGRKFSGTFFPRVVPLPEQTNAKDSSL
jgi:hypothetical protein